MIAERRRSPSRAVSDVSYCLPRLQWSLEAFCAPISRHGTLTAGPQSNRVTWCIVEWQKLRGHNWIMTIQPTLLSHLSDSDLLIEASRAAASERSANARLICVLAELDARRLYLGEGCSSLFTYCTQVLHLRTRRIRAHRGRPSGETLPDCR